VQFIVEFVIAVQLAKEGLSLNKIDTEYSLFFSKEFGE
jgi:hypothetical protein